MRTSKVMAPTREGKHRIVHFMKEIINTCTKGLQVEIINTRTIRVKIDKPENCRKKGGFHLVEVYIAINVYRVLKIENSKFR